MQISYKMANGKIELVEVNEEVGNFLLLQERAENNFTRNARRRNTCSLEALTECGVDISDKRTNIEKQIINKTIIEDAVLELKEKQRRIVLDVFIGDMPQSEVAKRLNISKGAMSKKMKLIRQKLKSRLKKSDFQN